MVTCSWQTVQCNPRDTGDSFYWLVVTAVIILSRGDDMLQAFLPRYPTVGLQSPHVFLSMTSNTQDRHLPRGTYSRDKC